MRLSLLVLAAALLVSACSSGGDGTPTPTATATPIATPVPTATPTPAPPIVFEEAEFEVRVTEDVVYGKALSHRAIGAIGTPVDLTLDIYEPIDEGTALHPAMVVIHGGGFSSNSSKTGPFVRIAEYFAARGWVTISINYRLSGEHGTFPSAWPNQREAIYAATRDSSAAVRWLHAQSDRYEVDTDRITAIGASAGAIIALALGSAGEGDYRDEISVEEDWTLATTRLHESSRVQTVIDLWGSLAALTDLEAYDGESRIDEGDAPLLILHGTEDSIVPYDSGIEVQRAFEAAGVPVVLIPLFGEGHSPFNATVDGRSLHEVSFDFIARHQGLEVR